MKLSPLSMSLPRRQNGVTLIELLVALALGLAVLVGLSAVYVAAKQAFRFQETAGRLQEDATFALEIIARDLRMAGYAGCRGVDPVTPTPTVAPYYYPNLTLAAASTGGIDGPNPLATVEPANAMVTMQPLSPQNFLRGFDNVPSTMFATANIPTTSSTDSLFFSGGSSSGVSLTAVMTAANGNLTIGADPFGWGNATVNSGVYNMIVSDCATSSLFAGKVATSSTQIDHSVAMGNTAASFPLSPLYGVDAVVMPLEWSFYYVATRSGATTPSLYRVFYDGNERKNAEEIVSNVESMKLNYGENIYGIDSATTLQCTLASAGATCVPTMQTDVWRTTASAVTDWSRVVAVRIGLMMVSADNSANPDVTTVTPSLLGASYTVPTGASSTRLRKEFSTTVVLRNRILPR